MRSSAGFGSLERLPKAGGTLEETSPDGGSTIDTKACRFLERLSEVRDSIGIIRALTSYNLKVFALVYLLIAMLQGM